MAVHRYRFGNCELSVINRRLLIDGQAVDLQPRAFDLLLYLAEHAGRLVTKDELLDNVWGQRFVTESVIARMVMKVRKAIGDDAGDPRFILTQYGTGYRFIGEVERLADPPADERAVAQTDVAETPIPDNTMTVAATEETAPAQRTFPTLATWRRYALPLAAVVVLAAALLAVVLPRPGHSEGLLRVAVLPIANETGDEALVWTKLGLMSAIGDAVQQQMSVDLIPAAEVLSVLNAVPGDALTPDRLAALRSRLGADALVVGRLRRPDKTFDLEIALFRNDRESPLAVLNDKQPAMLAAPAGESIAKVLAPEAERHHARQPVASDPYVDDTYARALDAIAREHFDEAVELLRVVVRNAGDQLEPRNRLAASLLSARDYKGALEQTSKVMEIAKRQSKPLALARAYITAANAHDRDGDLDRAESDGKKALALATREFPAINAEAHGILSVIMAQRGRLTEARRLMEAVIVDNQNMKSSYRLAAAYYNLGIVLDQAEINDASGARHSIERALEYARLSGRIQIQVNALGRLANIERKEGDCKKAFEYLDTSDAIMRANKMVHVDTANFQQRAFCLNALGRSREALAAVDAWEKVDVPSRPPYLVASIAETRITILQDMPAHSSAQVWSLYGKVLAIYKKLGMLTQLKNTLSAQARYAAVHGRQEEAKALLAQAQGLVDGGKAGDDIVVQGSRAVMAYYARSPQRALDLLHAASSSGNNRDSKWISRAVQMAWIQLDLGAVPAAAKLFGTVASYQDGYVTVCLLGARLAYEQDKHRAAASKQKACIARLGERASPAEYALLDVYSDADTDAKPKPLQKPGPAVLWL